MDQHLDKHWPGGAVIKMTLGLITPKGNIGGGEANGKTKVGPCWRVLFKGNCQGVPIITHRVRNAKSRNITPVYGTRATRVEQVTRHKAEPSTLYQVYKVY